MNSSKSTKVLPLSSPKFVPDDFRIWTSQNLYRTSTADMQSPRPPKNKTSAIPGYQGAIPGSRSDNNFGKTFTKISREQLSRPVYLTSRLTEFFPNKPQIQSPMGRTLGKFGGGLQDEYHTVSHFHGQSTLSKEHPNYIGETWATSSKTAFTPQEGLRKHIFRTTNVEKWKNTAVNSRETCKNSGFVKNGLVCDGEGWLPIKELHGDMIKTEYRNKYNHEIPFHPKPLKPNPRKLNKKNEIVV